MKTNQTEANVSIKLLNLHPITYLSGSRPFHRKISEA